MKLKLELGALSFVRCCRTSFIGVMLVFLSLWHIEAMACSCVNRDLTYRYDKASIVVLAKVVRVTKFDENKSDKNYVPKAVVRIEETFKGSPAREITLDTNNNGTCGLYLQKGDRAVLFLDARLAPGPCDGSFKVVTDDEAQKFWHLSQEDTQKYRENVDRFLDGLNNLKPKHWWEFWR